MKINKLKNIKFNIRKHISILKKLNIKKRLIISNISMILIPVVICMIAGSIGLNLIWDIAENNMGINFTDSKDFYERVEKISENIEESLFKSDKVHKKQHKQDKLTEIMKTNMMSVKVYENNKLIYQNGNDNVIPPRIM